MIRGEAPGRGRRITAAWLVAALALALAVRLPPVLATAFPLNDGGIFCVMSGELADAHLALPRDTAYNRAGIPFAYPPLGLYVAAALHLATGAPIATLQRALPLLADLLAVPAFFFLARRVLRSEEAAGVAALVFAVLPRSYEWLIMGGGLTRAFGFLFLVLAALSGNRLFVARERRAVFPTAFALALAVLSHPEMGINSAAWLALLVAAGGIDRWKITRALETAGLAAVVVAPWVATVAARHGLAPFLGAAGSSGFWLRGSLARLASPAATGETGLPLVACLALLGGVVALARREFVLPGWVLAAFVLTPRAAPTPATVPFALLAAVALDRVLHPGLESALAGTTPPVPARRARVVYGAVVALVLAAAVAFSDLGREGEPRRALRSVPPAEREAMAWVAAHTPAASTFVVATTAAVWSLDPVDAWFPALAARASVCTPNGAEWLPRGGFQRREQEYSWLKRCGVVDGACLDSLAARFDVRFSYVYVSKGAPTAPGRCPPRSPADTGEFAVVYDGPGATIYERKETPAR
jgi:hypothetical protein